MTHSAAATDESARGGTRVAVQRFGTFLSGMIMPNIPALIAWGIVTAFFIPDGWTPNEGLATLVSPTIHYLLPLLIANTGGRMVYQERGGVVATVATIGVIAGSDYLIAEFNATLPEGESELGQVHMFIGAMIMGPLAAWVMKRVDALWEGKIKAGFEMLVNMFSAGILALIMAVFGFYVIARVVNWIMEILSLGVSWLIDTGWLPLVSVLIEPAKVFFLNNAINHGVLTPLGTQMAATEGKSILFLLEANPGPGLGILLAFTFFGVGAAKATAPGAAIIHFFGGIHEIYFPYVLMKPALLAAVILGGATGVGTNMLFDAGLRAPASPGSIIAIIAQTASDSYVGVILSVLLSATVSFLVAGLILRLSRKRDLENEDALAEAIAQTEANKGKKSDALAGLAAASVEPVEATAAASVEPVEAGSASAEPVETLPSSVEPVEAGSASVEPVETRPSSVEPVETTATSSIPNQEIHKIVFACDAGMGSSAMGASIMRNKLKKAGFGDIQVVNLAIANLDASADLVITQTELTRRARQQSPDAIHVSVGNFMNSPRYDEVVEKIRDLRGGGHQ